MDMPFTHQMRPESLQKQLLTRDCVAAITAATNGREFFSNSASNVAITHYMVICVAVSTLKSAT
jgi:hypothetical protein